MANNLVIFKNLADIKSIKTTHGVGLKSVFLNSSQSETSLTQFAYGILKPNEEIEPHIHESMEEYYYFTKGKGVFIINESEFLCKKNTFLRIPVDCLHYLKCTGSKNLEFLYVGIAI